MACDSKTIATGPFQNLGLQLFTLRDLIAQDPTNTLATVAKIGYGLIAIGGKKSMLAAFRYLLIGTIGASLHRLAGTPLYQQCDLILQFIKEYILQDNTLRTHTTVENIEGKRRPTRFTARDYLRTNYQQ